MSKYDKYTDPVHMTTGELYEHDDETRAERDVEWLAAIDNVSESMADTVNVGQAIKIRNFIIDLKARMTGETENG